MGAKRVAVAVTTAVCTVAIRSERERKVCYSLFLLCSLSGLLI